MHQEYVLGQQTRPIIHRLYPHPSTSLTTFDNHNQPQTTTRIYDYLNPQDSRNPVRAMPLPRAHAREEKVWTKGDANGIFFGRRPET